MSHATEVCLHETDKIIAEAQESNLLFGGYESSVVIRSTRQQCAYWDSNPKPIG